MNSAVPLITVVTSTYNRSRELRRAIESVRSQTYSNWQHCVVGDCTPDDSEAVVASFDDPRISFYNLPVKSPEGAHGAIAKNYALQQMAQGTYIAYLDDDDAYLPSYLEKMVDYFGRHPEAQVLYCRSVYRDKDSGAKIFGNPFQRWMHGYSHEKLQRYNFLNTNGVMHLRDLVDRVGGWDPTTFFDDYEFWLRLAEVAEFHYLNKALVVTFIKEEPFIKRLFTKGWQIMRFGRHTPVR